MKISTLTMDEFVSIYTDSIELERAEHAGMITARCNHPDLGDITLTSGNQDGSIMIQP